VLSLGLGLASVLILFVVYHFAVSEAERAAARQANLMASALLQREVQPGDLARPVTEVRRSELDTLFQSQLLAADVLVVSLVRTDGLVTYSTDHGLMGTYASPTLASEAALGVIVSRTSRTVGEGEQSTETLETYAPVSRESTAAGAALVVQPYAPIHRAARAAQLRVGGVLEVLLLVLLAVLVPVLIRVTRRIKAQIDKIHFQAFYDPLTKLPNRVHLIDRLEVSVARAADSGRQFALLLLDLDRFREVNDTLGHEAGDALLAETGARLTEVLRGEMLLARLGGDEFAVVTEYTDEQEVDEIAEQIRGAVDRPILAAGLTVAVDVTVGIAYFPKDGSDAETLLKRAEIATHTAKEWRVGTLAYSPAVDPSDPEQLQLLAALREAVDHDQLVVHYQPKVELATGVVVGFEALAYWQHPTRGLLPPGAFVPIAERTGVIRHVSRRVLADAVEQIAAWEALGGNFTVAVNLTAIDLLDLGLPQQIDDLLRDHGVDPVGLCIEITESSVMADPERVKGVLDDIVSTGIRVAIDDFGTGHSSLAYLKNLPVDEVKIDRSFVSSMHVSPHDRLIVQATIQLGHSLGFQIVAEGVETHDARDALRTLGCDYAQGYLYGRPSPAHAVVRAAWGREAA
jgi:diguanylate cyclase (GGDEF)-like protein